VTISPGSIRTRSAVVVALLVLLVASSALVQVHSVDATIITNQKEQGLNQFVAWARNGVTGTFSATYRVDASSAGPGGTLVVAQKRSRGSLSWPTGRGWWSFVFRSSNGRVDQWIEHGTTAWDCFRFSSDKALACYGPAPNGYGNGWIDSMMPYLPGAAAQSIANAVKVAEASPTQLAELSLSIREGPPYGHLRCLRISAKAGGPKTWCLDYEGFFVSQTGMYGGVPGFGSNASLVRMGPTIPASAFKLLGPSKSKRGEFVTLPI
jgi:hypothetical protein